MQRYGGGNSNPLLLLAAATAGPAAQPLQSLRIGQHKITTITEQSYALSVVFFHCLRSLVLEIAINYFQGRFLFPMHLRVSVYV